MAQPTVPGVVHKGDLILVYKPKKAHMLLVKSAPNHTDNANAIPNAASITVQKVNWHIPGSPGFWTLSGPEVYYIDKAEKVVEDEELHNSNFIYSWYCLYEDHSTDLEEDNLEEFLKTMVSANADANDDSSDVSLIVNPHGRDVIKHYFKGSCPNCGTLGWFCPGCGGVSVRFPDIFGSCATDQSCPVCLGYEFALEDKRRIRELHSPEMSLSLHKDGQRLLGICKAQIAKMKTDTLALVEERYRLIHARKIEMGLKLEDQDKLIQDWKDSHL